MKRSGITIDHSTLQQWVQNFRDNKELPSITDSAAVSLVQLENFIAEAKEKYPSPLFNAIKIYFIRYVITESNENILKENNKDISQQSIVLVPVKKADPLTWTGEDFTFDNEQLFVLPFCNPANPPDNIDETGVCEPKCGRKLSSGK